MKRLWGRLLCWLGSHDWNRFVYQFRAGEYMSVFHQSHIGNVVCKRCEEIWLWPIDFMSSRAERKKRRLSDNR